MNIAVIIPCLNEAAAIGSVVAAFRRCLPEAQIYVYDNGSTDDTANVAVAAGARVKREPRPGKGNVVRRMFSDVEADIYVLVDGDDTYDATSAPAMVRRLVEDELDMVTGVRRSTAAATYRRGHRVGNRFLTGLVRVVFGSDLGDMLSGFRVFSRRFVKSFPALAAGFEIETELTVHALELRMPTAEIATPYRERPAGTGSKLHTVSDGIQILRTIILLVKEERPLPLLTGVFVVLATGAVVLALPIVAEFRETGLVPRFPTAILATGMMLLAFLSLAGGMILDTVTLGRREMKRMFYLSLAGVAASTDSAAGVGAATSTPHVGGTGPDG
jgi:hypothetical protein